MIKTGICSITLSKLPVEAVIDMVKEAGLDAIEWWGKDHVPDGDLVKAEKVKDLTLQAGIEISSYGSYYHAGVSEHDGLNFQSVLDTAVALGAPAIRVWAGDKNYEDASGGFIQKVIDDTMRIADMAAEKNINIIFEYHRGTFTNLHENAVKFAGQVPHENVFFSWQSPHGYSCEQCLESIKGVLDRLKTIHVFHWTINEKDASVGFVRQPLVKGVDSWRRYVELLKSTGRDYYMLMEFVRDDSTQQFLQDAKVLKNLVL